MSLKIKFAILILLAFILSILNIFVGSVDMDPREVWEILCGNGDAESPYTFIVLESRIPQAITALLAGAALTVSGLLLQTAFRNPLAGPSVLGITAGGSLGVALVMLMFGGSVSAMGFSAGGYVAIVGGAFAGCVAVMGLLIMLSAVLKNDLMLLIAGIMVGYLTSSVITLLNYTATAEGVHSYTMWGMGSFNGVGSSQLWMFSSLCLAGLLLSLLLVKPLNIVLLGESYARNLGVSMQRVRNMLLMATGLLTAVVTAYCGPVSFIGLAVPHIARMIFRSADHRIIIPGCMLTGGIVALLCNIICILPGDLLLPLNGVTPIIGVPVVLYVILKKKR